MTRIISKDLHYRANPKLKQENFWKIRAEGNRVLVVHLNNKVFEDLGLKVGDEINYDLELELFFQAMEEAGYGGLIDGLQDTTVMNGNLIGEGVVHHEPKKE